MEQEIGTWDSVLLENLSEDTFISNLHQRYKRDYIYTYIGTSVVAVNPFKPIPSYTPDLVKSYGSKGIFQLPPHIYGLANLAYQSLKNQSEDQCIILSGESGSGKTESFKSIVHFLTHIQESKKPKSKYHFPRRRNSSSCSVTICSRPNSRPSTPKRQSPVTNVIYAEKSGCLLKARSESSDRATIQRKLSREKMVDFDFSHHKSSENIPQHTTATQTTPKSCFKHNHIDTFGRSKTLVDYSIRKSYCDLTRNLSTNKINETLPSSSSLLCTKLGSCCSNRKPVALVQHSSNPLYYDNNKHSCGSIQLSKLKHESSINRQGCKSCDSTKLCSRTSLFDSHRLCQHLEKEQTFSTTSDCPEIFIFQKIRDRVACCSVFLEAMGNATTTKNSNSSRFGKFFDMEIDFKGDPIGIHITHYSGNTIKLWRTQFSYILSIITWC